jgi:hypothetical protein
MTFPPRSHRHSRMRSEIQRALVPRPVANPLVVTWRWRYEIVMAAALAGGLTAAAISLGAAPVTIVVGIVAVTIACWRAPRQFIVDRAWCVITPHRVRVGCVEGLVYSSQGKIPVILWTSRQPFGERVALWCRAGISVDDFVAARAILTATCWAQDITIVMDARRPHLVSLDIRRRAPVEPAMAYGPDGPLGHDDGPPAWPGNRARRHRPEGRAG